MVTHDMTNDKHAETGHAFPGMSDLSMRDTREAIKLGWMNYDSVKPEYQPELKARLEALEAHRLHLLRVGKW